MTSNLPKKGAWVLIREAIPVENAFAPFLSVWYAVPHTTFFIGDENSLNPSIYHEDIYPFPNLSTLKLAIKVYLRCKSDISSFEAKTVKRILDEYTLNYQAIINTPFGQVILKPHEFNVIDINYYIGSTEDGSYQIKFITTDTKGSDRTLRDKLFYIRSRGISLTSALTLISSKSIQNFYYLLPHPAYQKMYLRNYDQYKKRQDELESTLLKKDSQNIKYFFDEEEALKMNQKYK